MIEGSGFGLGADTSGSKYFDLGRSLALSHTHTRTENQKRGRKWTIRMDSAPFSSNVPCRLEGEVQGWRLEGDWKIHKGETSS